jgi:hypothetical protein
MGMKFQRQFWRGQTIHKPQHQVLAFVVLLAKVYIILAFLKIWMLPVALGISVHQSGNMGNTPICFLDNSSLFI